MSGNKEIKQVAQLYPNSGNPQAGRVYDANGISPAMDTCQGGNRMPKIVDAFCCASRGRNPENPTDRTPGLPTEQRLEVRQDGLTNTITTVQKDNYVMIREATKKGYAEATEGDFVNIGMPNSQTRRGRVGKGIANTLTTMQEGAVVVDDNN